MSSLAGLAVGDSLMVHDIQARYTRRTVAKTGRVWLTDNFGDKFRIDTGRGEERNQYGAGFYAVTVAEWEVIEETERLKQCLASWGWAPWTRSKRLTLDQMRRAAALLAEFEAEQ